MVDGFRHPVGSCSCRGGFTLIELLVVIAVISVLLAISLAALHKTRTLARRARCASQVRQIAMAWHTYLGDSDQRFYHATNANHDFGGWRGASGGAVSRPLNRYVGLPTEPNTWTEARLFRCPADQGDGGYGPVAYLHYGNSYQANMILIGPPSLPTGMPNPIKGLNRKINEHRRNLRADAICDPTRLLLVGDNNWLTHWDALFSNPVRAWHGVDNRFNMAFFDGHVGFIEIHKGVYLDDDYRVQPFEALDDLTHDVQSQILDIIN